MNGVLRELRPREDPVGRMRRVDDVERVRHQTRVRYPTYSPNTARRSYLKFFSKSGSHNASRMSV